MSLPAVVIGLGAIGMGYDLDAEPDGPVVTHARAFERHSDFTLVAGVDPDAEKRRRFTARYEHPAYATTADMFARHDASVAAIAVPTCVHAEVVRQVVAHPGLRAIVCEKPLAASVADAREVRELCAARDIQLVVNFMRRSEPGAHEIASRIASGQVETPVKGVAWYSKGFLHNASHLVNLLEHWLGAVEGSTIVDGGRPYLDDDAEPDVRIAFERGTVLFVAAREESFSHLTIELVAANGLLRYDRGGEVITWQRAQADPMFDGYTTLPRDAEHIASDMAHSQWHVTDQLARLLRGESFHLCTGEDALRTLESMHDIMSQR